MTTPSRTATPIQTTDAPAAIGPYSQAVRLGSLVFTSGQIPLLPDGTLPGGDGDHGGAQTTEAQTIEVQTRQVLDNLRAVLAAAGSDLSRVLKSTVFLADMGEFPRMNAVYAEYFSEPYPARSTVQVARLPRDVRVEIEVVAEAG